MPPKKRMLNFELVLRDELVREFGRKEGPLVFDHLRMIGEFRLTSEISGMNITFDSLPFLGENCLRDVFGDLFKGDSRCALAFNAFKKAREAYVKNSGKRAAGPHKCALAFTDGCNEGEKECLAKKLMAGGNVAQPKASLQGTPPPRNCAKKM